MWQKLKQAYRILGFKEFSQIIWDILWFILIIWFIGSCLIKGDCGKHDFIIGSKEHISYLFYMIFILLAFLMLLFLHLKYLFEQYKRKHPKRKLGEIPPVHYRHPNQKSKRK